MKQFRSMPSREDGSLLEIPEARFERSW